MIFSVRPFFDSTVPAPLRIALDATDRLYVLSPSERRIRAFDPSGAALFTLGDGQFAFPQAIAIGVAGRIYVADGGSNQSMRIQVFDHGGTFLFTFGSFCRLDTSEGCVDLDGAGPLALGDGQFASIDHLTIDAAGRVYIVDGRYFPANARIQVFDPDGNFLFKFGSFCYLGQNVGCIDPDGTGPLAPGDGQFLLVIALTIDSAGQIYILDQNRDTQFLPVPRLQVFDGAGRFLFKLGSLCSLETNFGCIPPDGVYLREPGAAQFGAFGDSGGVFSESLGAVLVDGAGSIYVADTGNRRIVKFDQQFHPVLTPQFGYGSTVRIATDPAGNLYAADDSIPRIQKLDPDGNVLLRFGGPCNIERGEVCTDPDGDGPLASGDGQFNSPRAIATDSAGRVYVADGGAIENVRIQVFDPAAGTFLFKFGSFCSQTGFGCVDPDGSGPLQSGDGQFTDLVDLAVDGAGQIYLSDQGNGRILLFDATGRFVTKFARPGTRLGEFVYPDGIAVDRRGRIYVADNGASRVQVFGPASRDTTPPVVTAPSNQVAEATGSAGAVVNYPPASATDDVAVVSGPSCAPATGSSFAIGATEVTCTARDAAGNTGSASFMVTVRDTTPPTLTLPSALVTQATGGSAAVVTFSASAQDVVDGARAVTCAPTSGSSFTVGTTMVACSASDGRGNTARGSFTVTVGYAFTGFRQPVDNPPTVNVTKAGTAVPVKFSLRGNQGLAVFTSGSPSSSPAVCQTGAPLDTIDQTVTAGSTGLSYDATLDQYVYVWKTDKAWADTCRQLIVRFRDGTQYVANFRFTR